MSRATPMAPDERRQAIIGATLPLLLDRGPDLTTREIAQASGVAEGTIFRVFETKDDLIQSVVEEAMQPTATLASLAALGPQPLEDRVSAILEILSADLQRVRSLFAHLAKAGFDPHPGGPPKPKQHHHHDGRTRVITAAAAALDPYADELGVPTATAAQLLSALSFATNFSLGIDQTGPDPHNLARLVLHGIAKGDK
ncbi:MAG: TetR/AcrR family transcriptional regulator [Propionicimonas sp.]|uniref:TetR/AcrR family transcriptional regulator n=1 Tax=Propionicimonas sp. TaxID=1955623 RepID=UPI003D123671